MSQLLRVDPSALASSLPATGWRPARRGRPGATRDGCDLYTFILWAGSTRRDREGGSCSVLYSDLLRAVGTPVPGEMINGASHYSGSPLILLNKDSRMVAREHEGRPGRRRVKETKRLATDEPATRLVSARGVWRVFSKTFCQKWAQGRGNPPFYRSGESRRRPEIADARWGSVTRDRVNGGPGGRHLHTGLVMDRGWPGQTVTMVTPHQCKKVIGLDWDNWDNLGYSVAD